MWSLPKPAPSPRGQDTAVVLGEMVYLSFPLRLPPTHGFHSSRFQGPVTTIRLDRIQERWAHLLNLIPTPSQLCPRILVFTWLLTSRPCFRQSGAADSKRSSRHMASQDEMAAVSIVSMVSAGVGWEGGIWRCGCRQQEPPPPGPSSCSFLYSFPGLLFPDALSPLSPCKVHQPHTLPTSSPGNGVLGLLSKPWECSMR